MESQSSFCGLDRCALCGAEIEGLGERRVSLEGYTYVFCDKCTVERRKRIDDMLKLRDEQ
ncbi:MAG: hypothetical protein QXH30_00310 [Candidatus Bilamarchaeaceae archaeon]